MSGAGASPAAFLDLVLLTAPLFLLVFVGYALSRWGHWSKVVSDALTRFVFGVAIPAFLFRLMSDFSKLPAVDARLLLAYFGGGLLTFGLARLVGGRVFAMDGSQQSIFGVGTIFSNLVLLGIPLAKVTLGERSLPSVSLVVVFNSLILWTLVTVSVEWARHRDLSLRGLAQTARDVITNPIVAAILLGTGFGFTGVTLPRVAGDMLGLISQAAVPLSLIVLGMGLAEYGVSEGWRESVALALLKLAGFPAIVYGMARAIGLPLLETQSIVMLASLPMGANVYLMARQFGALEGPVASAMVITVAASALTTPLLLTFIH